jgi:hypothetical protein
LRTDPGRANGAVASPLSPQSVMQATASRSGHACRDSVA